VPIAFRLASANLGGFLRNNALLHWEHNGDSTLSSSQWTPAGSTKIPARGPCVYGKGELGRFDRMRATEYVEINVRHAEQVRRTLCANPFSTGGAHNGPQRI